MGTSELNVGGNPAVDYHPIEILLVSLHAIETGISSSLIGHNWLVCKLYLYQRQSAGMYVDPVRIEEDDW